MLSLNTLLFSALLLLSALFSVHVEGKPVGTNAYRMARGLPPAPPVRRFDPSRVAGAQRSTPSGGAGSVQTGYIVAKTTSGSTLGYLSSSGVIVSSTALAVEVKFTQTSPTGHYTYFTDVTSIKWPSLYTSSSDTLGSGKSTYATMFDSPTLYTSRGVIPSGFAILSSAFAVNPSSGLISVTWQNSAGSVTLTPGYSTTGSTKTVLFPGDLSRYNQVYPVDLTAVNLFFDAV